MTPSRHATPLRSADAAWVTWPGPMVQEAELAAAVVAPMTRADEAFGDVAGVVGWGLGRGGIALRTISGFPKCRSVGTHMAVGQVAIFRSVARRFGDASKIIKLYRLHRHYDTSTDRN